MFAVFSAAEEQIIDLIGTFVATPVMVLTGGISILAGSFVTVWFLYRAYLILAGLISDPIMSTFKDFLIKAVIITIAGVHGNYVGDVYLNIDFLGEDIAQDMVGSKNASIFANLDGKLSAIVMGLETIQSGEKQDNTSLVLEHGEGWEKWLVVPAAWIHDKYANSSVGQGIEGAKEYIITVIKIMLVALGFLILGFAAFVTVIMNKVFLNLCLAVGPLFVFFAAFEKTRGWFSSWLNMTLGYCFSYPMVMIVITGLLKIFDTIFQPSSNTTHLTWASVLMCLVLCFIFAMIISRVGDLASGFFGAGNIADGTALAVAAAGSKAGGQMSRPINSVGNVAGGATKQAGMAAGRKIKEIWDGFKKPSAGKG